jgi:hypothetical protein
LITDRRHTVTGANGPAGAGRAGLPGRFSAPLRSVRLAVSGWCLAIAYTRIEIRLQRQGAHLARDAIAGQLRALLLAAAFGGQPVNPDAAIRLIGQGRRLLNAARAIS